MFAHARGVLYAMGGSGGGLTCYMDKGQLVYEYNLMIIDRSIAKSQEKLAPGKHTIHIDMAYNGPGMGKSATGTLSVDGKQVAQGKIERTVPLRFSLDETIDVGEDTGTPVVEDYVNKMPFKFTGELKKVVIELGKSGLAAGDEKKIEAARKLAAIRE